MDRSQKVELVQKTRDVLSQSSLVVVAKQSGLSVSEATDLRRRVLGAGANMKVMKNTLARIAVQDSPMEGLKEFLNGPTALAFSKDPIAAAKVIVKFATENQKLEVLGGFMDGRIINKEEIKAIATLPSLDELRAKLLAMFNTPATRLATVIKEPASQVARVLSARAESQG